MNEYASSGSQKVKKKTGIDIPNIRGEVNGGVEGLRPSAKGKKEGEVGTKRLNIHRRVRPTGGFQNQNIRLHKWTAVLLRNDVAAKGRQQMKTQRIAVQPGLISTKKADKEKSHLESRSGRIRL